MLLGGVSCPSLLFEVDGALVAQGGMPPVPIVEHLQIVKDGASCLSSGHPANTCDEFGLERREEALGHRVVETLPTSTHRAGDSLLGEKLLIG